jgi:hypothetical protein
MELIGANEKAEVIGLGELPAKSNYFIGNDPKKWRTNVPNYAKVRYANVYPGVDLVYYGNQGQLEYDFVLRPGAEPRQIALGVEGIRESPRPRHDTPLRVDTDGDLVVSTDGGEVVFHQPVIYQPTLASVASASPRHSSLVKGRYRLEGGNRIRFDVGPYDHSKPLLIDPVLVYSTYLGGTGSDQGEVGGT